MSFSLPPLPYPKDALQPHMSQETLEFHHGKHHAAYFKKLNDLVKGSPFESMSLVEIVKKSDGAVYNNAAQAWNHTFFWQSMSPGGGGAPHGPIADAINASFGSFDAFKEKFSEIAGGHFGSGWAWLVQKSDGSLAVVGGHDAHNPMSDGLKPILTCDVWEHAYYIDYRNARPEYIKAWWNLVNWEFANTNLTGDAERAGELANVEQARL